MYQNYTEDRLLDEIDASKESSGSQTKQTCNNTDRDAERVRVWENPAVNTATKLFFSFDSKATSQDTSAMTMTSSMEEPWRPSYPFSREKGRQPRDKGRDHKNRQLVPLREACMMFN